LRLAGALLQRRRHSLIRDAEAQSYDKTFSDIPGMAIEAYAYDTRELIRLVHVHRHEPPRATLYRHPNRPTPPPRARCGEPPLRL
jgi:hypothetical protein